MSHYAASAHALHTADRCARLGVFIPWMMLAAGCGFSMPGASWHYPTTTLEGSILLAGRPIEGGFVTLMPHAAAVGDHVIVPLDAAGKFRAPRVPIGPLQVRVALTHQQELADVSRFPPLARQLAEDRGAGSRRRCVTQEGRNPPLTLDLAVPPAD